MNLYGFDTKPEAPLEVSQRREVSDAIPMSHRAFEGGKDSRLLKDFPGMYGSINAEIYESHRALVGRSRQMAADNPFIKRFLALCKVNIVGDHGIRVQSRLRAPDNTFDKEKNKLVEKHWRRWSGMKNCTVSCNLTFLDVQRLVVESVKRDGEVLVHLVRGFDNEYGFALEVLDADYLDLQYDRPPDMDGNYIRSSVEFNQWNAPVAYHLLTQHPGENVYMSTDRRYRRRIPANDMLHIFDTIRAGQVRGIPATHAALIASKHLHEYIRSTLVAARVIASKFAVITTPASDGYKGTTSVDGNVKDQAEAGMIWRLNQGQSMEVFDPKQPSGEFDPFTRVLIQELAVALNVSYASLSEDLSRANFGSQRTSLTGERDIWKLDHRFFSSHLICPVFQAMIPMGMMFNAEMQSSLNFIDLDGLRDVVYQGRGWTWIDPAKDAQANMRQVQLGSLTYEQLFALEGKDLQEQFDQIEFEKKIIEEKELKIGPDVILEKDDLANQANEEEDTTNAKNGLRITG